MKNDLTNWIIANRDEKGLSELFLELDRKIEEKRIVMINNVRDGEDAKLTCGGHDALIAFRTFLMQPLQRPETSLDT